jgi:hypothetical protein
VLQGEHVDRALPGLLLGRDLVDVLCRGRAADEVGVPVEARQHLVVHPLALVGRIALRGDELHGADVRGLSRRGRRGWCRRTGAGGAE